MKARARLGLALAGCLCVIAQPPEPARRSVFRATTQLVQVDAVVTDSKDRHIRDLTAANFEILQDGRPQRIRSCVYIETGAQPGRSSLREPRRLVVLVQDLNISAESLAAVRKGLSQLVDKRLEPGDSMAIVVASRSGLFQGFTSDKERLRAAIHRIPSNLGGRTDTSAVEPIEADALAMRDPALIAPIVGDRARSIALSAFWGLRDVLSFLAAIPGRKGLVIVSDGNPVPGGARAFTGLANRGQAVVYHIDPRGMVSTAFNAADADTLFGAPISPVVLLRMAADRAYGIGLSQLGAEALPRETGGFAIVNSNDFTGALERVMEDLRGYYLLAYQPDSMEGEREHHIAVKVNRPGLRVRSREGFSAPGTAGIGMKLAPFLWRTGAEPADLKSYLYLDARDLTFVKEASGMERDVLDVVVTASDTAGNVVHRMRKTLTIRAGATEFDSILEYGFVSTLALPLPKPGVYWLSATVTERPSGKTGWVSQSLEIPDLAANRLDLSTIQLMLDGNGFATVSSSALRRFHRGEPVRWMCQVFHPAAAPAGPIRATLRIVGASHAVVVERSVEVRRIEPFATLEGRIRLGSDLPPGQYAVTIEVEGANQSIDFEVVD